MKKVKVEVYSFEDKEKQLLANDRSSGCCKSKKDDGHSSRGGCNGCGSNKNKGSGCSCGGSCGGCSKDTNQNIEQSYDELKDFINDSDINSNVSLELIKLNNINVSSYENIMVLLENGYESPFVIIDGIVRYYGGLSKELIYKDIKELTE